MLTLIAWILAFMVAITIHEASHAWMADHLGDPTPRMMGRLSLNPIVHYDKIGTTILLVLVILRALGFPVIPFGWAKPVRFDPFNLENPRRDAALISVAGPVSNILMAAFLGLVLQFVTPFSALSIILPPIIILNIVLAVFNIVLIHPLDGGKILVGLLPANDAHQVDMFLNRYGMLMLFFLIFPILGSTSPLFAVISPIINFFLNLFLPGNLLA